MKYWIFALAQEKETISPWITSNLVETISEWLVEIISDLYSHHNVKNKTYVEEQEVETAAVHNNVYAWWLKNVLQKKICFQLRKQIKWH